MTPTRVFLVGCIALVYFANGPYPRLYDHGAFFWIFISGFLMLVHFLRNSSRNNSTPKYLAALLPWLLASLFLANGLFDHSEEQRYSTVVLEMHFSYFSGIRDTIDVRSWRPGRTIESVYVRNKQGFFYPGERVTVGVRAGALGLSWISGVYR